MFLELVPGGITLRGEAWTKLSADKLHNYCPFRINLVFSGTKLVTTTNGVRDSILQNFRKARSHNSKSIDHRTMNIITNPSFVSNKSYNSDIVGN